MKTLFSFIFLLVSTLVFSQENSLWSPKPTILLLANDQPMAANSKITKNDKLTLKIVPNATRQQESVAELRYEISQIGILRYVGKDLVPLVGSILKGRDATQGIALPIPDVAFHSTSDGFVYFKIKDIYHKNFKGEIFVNSRFTEAEKTLIITVQK